MPGKRRVSHRRRRHTKKDIVMLGGCTSAADCGVAAYGNMGDQHAMPGGNVIKVTSQAGGGDEPENEGGSLQQLAVPAVLLVANQMTRKRGKSHKKRSHHRRRSHRRKR